MVSNVICIFLIYGISQTADVVVELFVLILFYFCEPISNRDGLAVAAVSLWEALGVDVPEGIVGFSEVLWGVASFVYWILSCTNIEKVKFCSNQFVRCLIHDVLFNIIYRYINYYSLCLFTDKLLDWYIKIGKQ